MKIEDLIGQPNIATKLDDTILQEIGMNVDKGYDIDYESMEPWRAKNKDAVALAEQVWEKKFFPFENAANVKYPLISTAAIQFAARAMPEFIKGTDIVRAVVVGEDPEGMKADRAQRISEHMSYQCINEMEEWEEDTDKLLTYIPIVGTAFKKTFFSKGMGRNVSEFKKATDVIINYWAKSMATAPRITETFTLYPNEIEERIRFGVFLNWDYGTPAESKDEREVNTQDPDQEHVFYEQHTSIDLDKDGYKEPYIVTYHKDTQKVVRMVARFSQQSISYGRKYRIAKIIPDEYYTKFSFMPNVSGSIYDTGFGGLLAPINSTINTLINQLIDSGTLYNLNAGFLGKGIQLGRGRGGGVLEFQPGEWKTLNFTGDDLRKHIVPLPVKEPSQVLFSLLGFMVNAGDRLSSVTEILTGEQSNEAERPTTTLARIEQGLKVFTAIHKRLYRAFKGEYKKMFKLNSIYLNPRTYFTILDTPKAVAKEDYDASNFDVIPVADPNETTNTQKMIRGQIWMGMKGQGFNDKEINKRFAEAMAEPEPEKLLNAPEFKDPKIEIEQAKLEMDADKFQFEMLKWEGERAERHAKVMSLIAKAEQSIAQAEAAEPGQQLDLYKAHLTAITEEHKMNVQKEQAKQNAQKPVSKT